AAGTMPSISARLDTSQRTVATAGSSFFSASSAASSMSQTNNRAPPAANARAISRPMPDAPAVINTRWLIECLLYPVRASRVLAGRAAGAGTVVAGSDPVPKCGERDGQPAGPRDESVPAAARGQPGRLVPVGRRGARARPGFRPPDPAVDRLLGVPLVPRDGARILRGSGDRRTR